MTPVPDNNTQRIPVTLNLSPDLYIAFGMVAQNLHASPDRIANDAVAYALLRIIDRAPYKDNSLLKTLELDRFDMEALHARIQGAIGLADKALADAEVIHATVRSLLGGDRGTSPEEVG